MSILFKQGDTDNTMTDLIVGYGYTGSYIAKILLQKNKRVIAWSRSVNAYPIHNDNFHHENVDVLYDEFSLSSNITTIYYLAPPLSSESKDITLRQFLIRLNTLKQPPKRLIYVSSSGVYLGNSNIWIKENSPLNLTSKRSQLRLDAESQIKLYCQANKTSGIVLRAAGIYGKERLPFTHVSELKPIIKLNEAPWVNSIYVDDLAKAAVLLAEQAEDFQIYNVSDGEPKPWGTLQRELAKAMHIQLPEISLASYKQQASAMALEFLKGAKKLSNAKLRSALSKQFQFSSLEQIIAAALKEKV